MADIKHTTSSGSVAVEVQADLGSSSLEAAVDEENSLPSDDESIIGSDDSNDSSGEEESGDQGSASEINVPTAADQKEGTSPTSRPKGNAPRRSKRSNFGNRYEQAISKEKEDDLKPPLRRNGNLLLGSTSKGWSGDEDDSEEEDIDFRPVERQNGADDSDQSQSGTESSSSESDDGSKKDAVEADPALTGRSKRKKDPLYLLTDQKRSLEELINEVAASSNLEGIRICSICLWDEYDIEKDAVVQCDSCGVAVHEGCYGVIGKDLEEIHAKDKDLDSQSSTETMPWFCDPCRFGQRNPICLACPTQFGAFKQTVKGDWIHCSCARYIKEIYFQDEEQLGDVVVSDLPYTRWGERPCVVCDDVYEKNSGITVHCETGMCRKFLHATCAMLVGSASEMEPELGYPLAIYCPDHMPKEDRAGNRRCYLASLALQRRYQRVLMGINEDERERLLVAEEKQRKMYLQHREDRGFVCELKHSVRPLHSAYSLLIAGHARSSALGEDPRPVVNANPSTENLHSSKPDFRPEFVAYVYKREKVILDYLERMEMAKREREDFGKIRGFRTDPARGKAAAKQSQAQLKVAKESLFVLMAPFMIHMEKKYLVKKRVSPKRKNTKSDAEESVEKNSSSSRLVEPRCKTCSSSTFPQRMLQCGDCHERFHLKCLDPPLLVMPKQRTGVKWLCAECVPSSEESEVDSMDGGLEGRKRRTLQGQNPLRLKRNDLGALLPAIPGHKKRGRKPGFRVQKKIKTEVEATPIKAEHEEKELGEVTTVSPRPSGRKARTVEEKSGSCVKCQTGCTSKTAVECDRCTNWYHFATCLDPPCLRSPRARFYGWLCEDCSSPVAYEAVFERDSSP